MKKTVHKVTEEDINKAIDGINVELAGSYGDGSSKSIKLCSRNKTFYLKVLDHSMLIAETTHSHIAMKIYNDLP